MSHNHTDESELTTFSALLLSTRTGLRLWATVNLHYWPAEWPLESLHWPFRDDQHALLVKKSESRGEARQVRLGGWKAEDDDSELAVQGLCTSWLSSPKAKRPLIDGYWAPRRMSFNKKQKPMTASRSFTS
jgi:hypothetical protein